MLKYLLKLNIKIITERRLVPLWENKLNKAPGSKEQNEQLSLFDDIEEQAETDSGENFINSNQELTPKQLSNYQILDDFTRFVDYLLVGNVYLTKTKEYISRKFLPNINRLLSVQSDKASKNSEQNYYPYIHLLFHIAIAGKLFNKVPGTAGNKTLQVTERLDLFRELTDLEKYYFLFETFWIDVDWDDLQEAAYRDVAQTLQELFVVFVKNNPAHANLLKTVNYVDENSYTKASRWHYFLLFFEWFGLWVTEPDKDAMDSYGLKSSYYAKSLTITDLGEQVVPILLFERNLQFWNIGLRWKHGDINALPGSMSGQFIFILPRVVEKYILQNAKIESGKLFLQSFKKLHPNETLQKSLPRQMNSVVDGEYTFKVSLTSGVWRTVVLSGHHTMENLHEIILQAFNFTDDHLYSFFLDGKRWSEKEVVSPLGDFGHVTADKVRIGELGIDIGHTFMYLFDYGAEWTFKVVLEDVNEQAATVIQPFIKASVGGNPMQYGY